MGTTEYFNKHVADGATDKEVHLEIGKTNFAGEGPHLGSALESIFSMPPQKRRMWLEFRS